MIVEWNCDVEPQLREVNDVDIDIQVVRNSRGNIESNMLEKTVQAIVSVFDLIKISVNSLLDNGSSLLFGVVDINLSISDLLLACLLYTSPSPRD